LKKHTKRVIVVVSPEILNEFKRTPTKDKFVLNDDEIDEVVGKISLLAMIIRLQTKANIVKMI